MTTTLADLTETKLLDLGSRGFAKFVSCLVASGGSAEFAQQQFLGRWPNDTYATHVKNWSAEKASVPAHSGASDPALVPPALSTAFAQFAAPLSIIGRLGTTGIPALQRVPFDVRATYSDPSSLANSFQWVRAGQPKPAVSIPFAIPVTLRRAKVSGIAVTTRELMRVTAPGSDAFVRDLMARAVGLALDRLFTDPTVTATDSSPASITNGATLVGSSSGNAQDDLRALLAAFQGSLDSAVLLIGSENAAALALSEAFPNLTARGGFIAGIPTLASTVVDDLLILLDTSRVLVADDNEVSIGSSEHAALEMSTTPTNASTDNASPAAPTHAQLVSMWQSNSAAVRVERTINWQSQTDACVYLTDCAYLTAGSPGA